MPTEQDLTAAARRTQKFAAKKEEEKNPWITQIKKMQNSSIWESLRNLWFILKIFATRQEFEEY